VCSCNLQPKQSEKIVTNNSLVKLSIIIPTYNESENILSLLDSIEKSLENNISYPLVAEIIVVDDNSPDRTAEMVKGYSQALRLEAITPVQKEEHDLLKHTGSVYGKGVRKSRFAVRVVHRTVKKGLVSAVLEGVAVSKGQYILVMDADFSHSPDVIPKMVSNLETSDVDIVVASRYVEGGSITGWPFKRRLISKGAVKIAKYGLRINKRVRDPTSGFFALRREVMEDIKINTEGYKILLEILVKANEAKVKEIPYTFTNRRAGKSKLDNSVIFNYVKAVYHLYLYGQRSSKAASWLTRVKKRKAVLFFYKAGRFYTVGASGLLINYLVSVMLNNSMPDLGYMQATVGGIIVSNVSNFVLNKVWTFEDRDFTVRKTLRQYGLFAAITAVGAAIQLGILNVVLEYGLSYENSLLLAVAAASISNFLMNKKLTFSEKIWG
jgi:dolichol-phosphate mannosyltransferase